jgi:hypothetical protein
MIDSYVFNKKDILSSEYVSIANYQEIVVPSLLRDFVLMTTRADILEPTGIKLHIYLKYEETRVSIIYQDPDIPSPPCFGCHGMGNIFLDQLAQEREDNLSQKFLTHFLIPFDPDAPLLQLDKVEHCYILKPPSQEQQADIFASYITRIRRL